jgi:hypothetical protein
MHIKNWLTVSGLVLSVTVLSVLAPSRPADACAGTITFVPVVCSKTLVMAKSSTVLFVLPPASPLKIPISVTTFCRSGPTPGEVCNTIAAPVSATSTLTLFSFPPAAPVATGTVSTGAGTMPMPACDATPAGATTTFPVSMTVALPVLAGFHFVVGSVSVTYDDGTTLNHGRSRPPAADSLDRG